MRSIQRKLAVLGASVLAMALMAVGASSAQAALYFFDGHSGEPCPDLVVEGNDVSGGCLVEDMVGGFDGYSGGLLFEHYDGSFDLRISYEGEMYAVNQVIHEASWPREPCDDDATGQVKPWTATTLPTTIDFCIEVPADGQEYTQNVPFDVEGGSGGSGHIESMTQADAPENGIRNADYDNLGDTEEVRWEWIE